jgi:hypothetical protein
MSTPTETGIPTTLRFGDLLEIFSYAHILVQLSLLVVGELRPITERGCTIVNSMMDILGHVKYMAPLIMPEPLYQLVFNKTLFENSPSNKVECDDYIKSYEGIIILFQISKY